MRRNTRHQKTVYLNRTTTDERSLKKIELNRRSLFKVVP